MLSQIIFSEVIERLIKINNRLSPQVLKVEYDKSLRYDTKKMNHINSVYRLINRYITLVDPRIFLQNIDNDLLLYGNKVNNDYDLADLFYLNCLVYMTALQTNELVCAKDLIEYSEIGQILKVKTLFQNLFLSSIYYEDN